MAVQTSIIFWLIANCWAQDYLYVNKNRPDVETRLTRKDFLVGSTNRRNLGQPFDKERVFRQDRFEGDIKGISESSIDDFIRESNRQGDVPQNGNQVYVQMSAVSQYSSRSRSMIAKAIQDFQSRTCLQFVPRTNQRDYVYIRPDDGCYSHVGRTGGQQTVSLDGGCFQHGTIIHEIMHSAGFFHEQNRNDRDTYVQVLYSNIMPGLQSNFAKRSLAVIDHLGTTYDYGSVMHYGGDYFSRNGQPTIVPRQRGARIGQRTGFSSKDVERLNKLYNCDGATGGGRPAPPPPPAPRPSPGGGGIPPDDDACYEKVPDSRYLLRIERGCYRVLKFRGDYIVTYCTRSGRSDFTMSPTISEARQAVSEAKGIGNRRCRGPGNVPTNRRPQPTPPAPRPSTGGRTGGSVGSWLRRWLGLRFSPGSQGDVPVGNNVHMPQGDTPDLAGDELVEIDL